MKNLKKKIGIVGNGFVGNAIATGLVEFVQDVKIYDIDPARSTHNLCSTVNESDVVFVSVPTPMERVEGGEIDLSILENCLADINRVSNYDSVIVVKSTVVPGTMERLQGQFYKLKLVFSPEFLTERFARLDFINSARVVLGGRPEDVNTVKEILKPRFPGSKFIETDFQTAQMIKYMANCFFAVKISFMNEMLQIARSANVDWDTAIAGFISDGRIGNSHITVPGHDGSLGFGGKCFPKDLNALLYRAEELGVEPTMLKAAWKKNLEVRQNLDWAEIEGAVTDK